MEGKGRGLKVDATKGFICNLSEERRGDRGRGKTRQRGSQVAGQGMIRFKVTERVCRKTGGGKYRSRRRKRLEVGTPGGGRLSLEKPRSRCGLGSGCWWGC